MNASGNRDQFSLLMEDATPILSEIFLNKPDYGMVGISFYFHAGKLQRIATKKKESKLPLGKNA